MSGIDAAGDESRRGISIPHSSTPTQDKKDVCDDFDKVEGKGGECDVKSRSQGFDKWIDDNMKTVESQIQKKAAQGDNDVTVCGSVGGTGNGNGNGNGNGRPGNCVLNGVFGGSGILYVKGDFRINGQAQWHGPVYVAEGGSIRINGGGGTANINGGLLMEGNTRLDMLGSGQVQYNSETIRDYFGTVPSLSTMKVQISNRSGTLVQ